MGQQLGEAMVKAGLISSEDLKRGIEERKKKEVEKIRADIDRRFPNTPDIMKFFVFLAENHPLLKNK